MAYTKIIKDRPFVEMGATYCMDKPVNFNYRSDNFINSGDYFERDYRQFSGLKLLLEPDNGISSGLENPVVLWSDHSGNNNNFSQTVLGLRPILTANVQNSLPMLLFDGEDDYIQCNFIAPLMSQPFTSFIVVKTVSATSYSVLYTGGATFSDYNFLEVFQDSNNWQLDGCSDSEGNENFGIHVTDILVDTSTHICIVVFNGSFITIYLDGIYKGSTSTIASHPAMNIYGVGAFPPWGSSNNPASGFFNGYIGDHGLYNRALNTSEVTVLNDGLTKRWGL